jgi:hypothetical protein
LLLGTACTTTGLKTPARFVDKHELVSSDLPALRIRVDSAFRFIGVVPFRIRDVAQGERFVFVDAEGKSVRRLVIAQFEAMLSASNETYNYSFAGAQVIAGYRFRQNPFAFSHAAAVAENPNGEAALTVAFLTERGYQVGNEVMSIRYLTVPDSARRHELIIFYIEPLAPTGARLDQLYVGDVETPLWESLAGELAARAEAAFDVLPIES